MSWILVIALCAQVESSPYLREPTPAEKQAQQKALENLRQRQAERQANASAEKAAPVQDEFKKGDVLALKPKYGWVPALSTLAEVRSFHKLIKAKNGTALSRGFANDTLRLFMENTQVEVISINLDPDEGVSLTNLPVALVKIKTSVLGVQERPEDQLVNEDQYYIPVPFLRADQDLRTGETLMPAFILLPDTRAIPKQGGRMMLWSDRRSDIPCLNGLFAYERYVKQAQAKDQFGLEQQVKDGELFYVPNLTAVLVIERHTNPFIGDNTHPLEVRFITGERKGQTAWVPEAFTMIPVLRVVTQAQAKALSK